MVVLKRFLNLLTVCSLMGMSFGSYLSIQSAGSLYESIYQFHAYPIIEECRAARSLGEGSFYCDITAPGLEKARIEADESWSFRWREYPVKTIGEILHPYTLYAIALQGVVSGLNYIFFGNPKFWH